MACQRVCIFTLIAYMFDFSRLCVFKCLCKLCGSWHAKEHWLQLFCFPLCVFKCFFKPPALCSLDVFSKCLLRRMHYHINCTCGLFSTVFLNVSSTCMSGRMQSHNESYESMKFFSTVSF